MKRLLQRKNAVLTMLVSICIELAESIVPGYGADIVKKHEGQVSKKPELSKLILGMGP